MSAGQLIVYWMRCDGDCIHQMGKNKPTRLGDLVGLFPTRGQASLKPLVLAAFSVDTMPSISRPWAAPTAPTDGESSGP